MFLPSTVTICCDDADKAAGEDGLTPLHFLRAYSSPLATTCSWFSISIGNGENKEIIEIKIYNGNRENGQR